MTNTDVENLNSPNETQTEEPTETPVEELENLDTEGLKSELQKKSEANRQLFERAKKAETEAKELKAKLPKEPEPKSEAKPKKSDEIGFDVLAFHNSKSDSLKVETEEDIDFVKKLKEETGKDTPSLLNSNYFKTEYAAFKKGKAVDNSVPQGTGSRSGNQVPPQKSLEYWMSRNAAKGKGDWELPPDTPENAGLTNKVIDALVALKK